MSDHPMVEVEGWGEYRKLILVTLERLDGSIHTLGDKVDALRREDRREVEELRSQVVKIQIELGMQKVKIGLMGIGSGVGGAGLVEALIHFLGRH